MPRPWRKVYEHAKYHVTCRGNGRERIFYADADCEKLMEQLKTAVEREGILLYAYALMSNHYHLMVETPHANIREFMHRLNTAYAMYFRHKRRRPGHCFQGRYGAKLVEGDEYLLRLTRYIHLNPIKIKSMKHKSVEEKAHLLEAHRWSSYRGYVDGGKTENFIDYRWLELMPGRSGKQKRRAYKAYVEAFLVAEDPIMAEAYGKSVYAIGADEFIDEVESSIREEKTNAVQKGDVRWPKELRLSFEAILKAVADATGIKADAFGVHGRSIGAAKSMAIELACRLGGMNQRMVAAKMGMSEHAVGKQRKRLAARIRIDRKISHGKYTLVTNPWDGRRL